jgi:hypothetical protein
MSEAQWTKTELAKSLTDAGLVLVAFELIKKLIVEPIKAFYRHTTFGSGMAFKSFEADVLSRHRNEFEACLLYLRDFMQAINAEDVEVIQFLRKRRNDVAHNLARDLAARAVIDCVPLLERADQALFKLSNYRTYIEIGADPEFGNLGIDWDTIVGSEYMMFQEIMALLRKSSPA